MARGPLGHAQGDRLADQDQAQAHRQAVVQAIDELPERERLVMSLYYVEELNLKEIGEVLGVSESRVSQILSTVVKKLRLTLQVG